MPAPLADVVSLTQQLVRINTTNPPGNESTAVELMAARLREDGLETAVIPYPDGENRSHVVGRLRGTGERPGLLFSGHVDVVPPGDVPWSVDPFGGELREGRLYGRGACDMKGGVAALVAAAGDLARGGEQLKGDLVVALTADEERNCLGADALVTEPLFDRLGAALVAEPTSLRRVIGEKGAFWVEVTFTGKTAHASMPHLGANAVAAMADFLTAWEGSYPTDRPVHPLLGTPTLTIGTIQGGVKVNVVPDRCISQIDMRTVPGVEHAELEARLRALQAEVCARRPGVRGDLRILSNRPPVSCPADSPLARALGAAAQAIAGVDPTPGGVPYCTEACVWVPQLGIPAVICGPGDPGMAHQPDECVETAQLEQAAAIYARAAADLLL
jgi:succinyl-diaminopimelate desuccinylase